MSADLRDALKRGVLDPDQLEQLIAFRAKELGLTFAEAVAAAADDALPPTPRGDDLALLIAMIAPTPV